MGKSSQKQWAGTVLGAAVSSLALAAAAPMAAAQTAIEETTERSIDIPAGPLGRAILALTDAYEVSILVPNELVAGRTAPAVSGSMSAAEALRRVLVGSGLTAEPMANGGFVIEARADGAQEASRTQPALRVTDEIVITGYKADTTESLRLPATLRELPQSVGVATQEIILDRRATSQRLAIEGIPGVNIASIQGGLASDAFALRGFSTNGNFPGFVRDNGLSAFNNYVADPELYERIEVIKGPASFISGLATAGGFVNRILKAPVDDNFIDVSVGGGTDEQLRATLDANATLGSDTGLAARLVVAYDDGGEVFTNTGNERVSILPSIQYTGDSGFRFKLTGNIQELSGQGLYGTPLTTEGEIPGAIEDSLVGPDNFLDISYRSVLAEADKEFANGLTLSVKGQYAKDDSSYGYVYAYQYGGIGPSGDFSIYAYATDPGRESYAGEVTLRKDFSIGGNESTIIVGTDYGDSKRQIMNGRFESLGAGNIANPDSVPSFPPGFFETEIGPNSEQLVSTEQVGVFVNGIIRPFDGTTVLAALRQDWVDQKAALFDDPVGEANPENLTVQFGVSQELFNNLNAYALYGESFLPNRQLTVEGELLDPLQGETYEAGLKWDALGGQLGATLAIFRTELDNVSSRDPANRNFSIGGQSQRNQGVEVSLQGTNREGDISLQLGYAFLDTEVTASTNENAVGEEADNAPRHTLSVTGRYDLPETFLDGASLGARLFYRSSVGGAPGFFSDQRVDGFVRTDLFFQYNLNEQFQFQLNVDNLTNERFVETIDNFSAYNFVGRPRSVAGTIRARF